MSLRRLHSHARVAVALAAFVSHLILGLLLAPWLRLCFGSHWYGVAAGGAVLQWWMKGVARILGLHVDVTGEPAPFPVLIVANHVSWLDIVAIAAVHPVVFVAKNSVRQWPGIGALAALAGTVFIERGSKNALGAVVDQLTARLHEGCAVAAFPEGTTTCGHGVNEFHSGIFQAAVAARCAVQPVALRYPCDVGEAVAPFVGDDTFVNHLLRVLRSGQLRVEVAFFPAISASHGRRRLLARIAHSQIERIVTGRRQADAA